MMRPLQPKNRIKFEVVREVSKVYTWQNLLVYIKKHNPRVELPLITNHCGVHFHVSKEILKRKNLKVHSTIDSLYQGCDSLTTESKVDLPSLGISS